MPFDDIVTCLPVLQEVLQGFRDENAFRLARDAMTALPIIESPLRIEVFGEAVELVRANATRGIDDSLRHRLPARSMRYPSRRPDFASRSRFRSFGHGLTVTRPAGLSCRGNPGAAGARHNNGR